MCRRAGNAQKTAMSRAKNQAKADSSNKGAEPQGRAGCSKPYTPPLVVCKPFTRCLRLSAPNTCSCAGNRQPAEAERGFTHSEGVCPRMFLHASPRAAPAGRCNSPFVCSGCRVSSLRSRVPVAAQCKICLQPFICTSSEAKLKEHSDSKHPKAAFADCFPDFVKK